MGSNWAVIDDIDALVDEQMAQFDQRTGYDRNNRATVPKCRCGEDFHGLPITEQMKKMRLDGYLDPGYVYADDTSRILCPGTEVEGPLWQPRPSVVHHTAEVDSIDRWVERTPTGFQVTVNAEGARHIIRQLAALAHRVRGSVGQISQLTQDFAEHLADALADPTEREMQFIGVVPVEMAYMIGFRSARGHEVVVVFHSAGHRPGRPRRGGGEVVNPYSQSTPRPRSRFAELVQEVSDSRGPRGEGPTEAQVAALLGQMWNPAPQQVVETTNPHGAVPSMLDQLSARRLRPEERPFLGEWSQEGFADGRIPEPFDSAFHRRTGHLLPTDYADRDGDWTEPTLQSLGRDQFGVPLYSHRIHPVDNITGVRFHRSPPEVRYSEVLPQFALNDSRALHVPVISERANRTPSWIEKRRLWWLMWLNEFRERAYRDRSPAVVELVGFGTVSIWQAIDIATVHADGHMSLPQGVERHDGDTLSVHWGHGSHPVFMSYNFAAWLGFEILSPTRYAPNGLGNREWQRRVGGQVYGGPLIESPNIHYSREPLRLDERQIAALAEHRQRQRPRRR